VVALVSEFILGESRDHPLDAPDIKTEQAKQAKLVREQQEEDIRAVMGTYQARRFVWETLSEAGIFKTTFTGDRRGDYNEGRRSMGLFLFERVMNYCPELYDKARDEHIARMKEGTEDDS